MSNERKNSVSASANAPVKSDSIPARSSVNQLTTQQALGNMVMQRSLTNSNALGVSMSHPDDQNERIAENLSLNLTRANSRTAYFSTAARSAHHKSFSLPGLGSGNSLEHEIRQDFEPKFGVDLSSVRIHRDKSSANASRTLGARAFTLGEHIVFAANTYSPSTTVGSNLLAHELCHVLQGRNNISARKMHRSPATELISSHTSYWNLNERALGHELLRRARRGEHAFVSQVINALGSGDRDDVAYEWMVAAADSDLQTASETAGGRQMLTIFFNNLVSGWVVGSERKQARRIDAVSPRLRHPRLVPTESYVQLHQGMHRAFVVRSSESERSDDELREGDQRISSMSSGVRMIGFMVEHPNGMLRASSFSRSGAAFAHFMFLGEYRLRARVNVPGLRTQSVERRINIERPDFTGASRAAIPADANITREMPATTLQQDAELVRLSRIQARVWAVNQGLFSRRTYEAWASLSLTMIRLDPSMTSRQVDEAGRQQAVAQTRALQSALDAETPTTNQSTWAYTITNNRYTGESSFGGYGQTSASHGERMAVALERSDFNSARIIYNTMIDGLDAWILNRIKEHHGEGNEHYQRLMSSQRTATAMREIEDHNPTRVSAYFHPKSQYLQSGGIHSIPLSLYYWKQDNEWHLKDLTAPTRTFEDTYPARTGENLPPRQLFRKLNYRDHFPDGYVYYQLPGQDLLRLEMQSSLTLSDYLSYVAMGAAAIGLILVTAGAGTPAVAAFGTGMLIGSSLTGALGAAVHMSERSSHGALDATTASIDVLQIIAGLAGAGAIVAGTTVRAAGAAARAGTALSGRAASLALLADSVYVPMLAASAGADMMTLAVLSVSASRQLQEIDRRGGSSDDRRQAKIMLFSQLLIMGGITALSVRGSMADIRAGRNLELELVNGVVHARLRGYGNVNAMLDDIVRNGPGEIRRLSDADLSSLESAISSGSLSETQQLMLLGEVVADARAYRLAEVGDRSLSWQCVRGACGPGRGVSAMSLGERISNSPMSANIDRFQAIDALEMPGKNHAFTVVRFSDGSRYLIDPTFTQFLRPPGSTTSLADATAQSLRHNPVDAEFLLRLSRDGFVKLNQTTAQQYARALGATPEHAARVASNILTGRNAVHTDRVGGGLRTVDTIPHTGPDVLSREELRGYLDTMLQALRTNGDPRNLLPYLERLRASLN